jgi:hypothetical protein
MTCEGANARNHGQASPEVGVVRYKDGSDSLELYYRPEDESFDDHLIR